MVTIDTRSVKYMLTSELGPVGLGLVSFGVCFCLFS